MKTVLSESSTKTDTCFTLECGETWKWTLLLKKK